MIFFWKIDLPVIGLFAFGSQTDWTWAFHAVAYALPVLVIWLVKNPLGTKERRRSLFARGTALWAGRYAAMVASLYVELWQGWAVKWNEGNFFDPIEVVIAILVGWVLMKILE